MSASVMVGLTVAVMLFWTMGAYNRLMRLRAHAITAFAAMAGVFAQYVAMVKTNVPGQAGECAIGAPDSAMGDWAAAWLGLEAAAEQFNVALTVAQVRALNGPTLLALQMAFATLDLSWTRLRELPSDLAGQPLPATLPVQWEQLTFQAELARAEFNRRVASYNEAIGQFPALLLARVFGFKPAQPI